MWNFLSKFVTYRNHGANFEVLLRDLCNRLCKIKTFSMSQHSKLGAAYLGVQSIDITGREHRHSGINILRVFFVSVELDIVRSS